MRNKNLENKVLDMFLNLIQAAEQISPDETGVTDLHHSTKEAVLLFRFNGKGVAVTVEEF